MRELGPDSDLRFARFRPLADQAYPVSASAVDRRIGGFDLQVHAPLEPKVRRAPLGVNDHFEIYRPCSNWKDDVGAVHQYPASAGEIDQRAPAIHFMSRRAYRILEQ